MKIFLARVSTPPAPEIAPFLILSRNATAAKMNAQTYLIKQQYSHWSYVYVTPLNADAVEDFLGPDVSNYVITPSEVKPYCYDETTPGGTILPAPLL